MDNLNSCVECGKYISPGSGILRQNTEGQVEAVCDDCLQLETQFYSPEPIEKIPALTSESYGE